MQKRLFHLSFYIVLLLAMDCFAAGGTYQVGQDQGGIYFQTDNDGGWYIDKSDLKHFKISQSGTYSFGKDNTGKFLVTDTNRKFYLDTKAKEKQDIENAKVNQEYEIKMTKIRLQEAKKNQQSELIKAQERQAKADRDLYQEIEKQKLEETQRMNDELIKARIREEKPQIGITTKGDPVIILPRK